MTYVALLFVPMSFIASLFSMNEDYALGRSHFWVYWVTALPVLFTFLIMFRRPISVPDTVAVSNLVTSLCGGVRSLPIGNMILKQRSPQKDKNTII